MNTNTFCPRCFSLATMKNLLAILFLVMATAACLRISSGFRLPAEESKKGRDVMYIWQDAKLLADGQNPYQRIAGQNMRDNQKYTFYLPSFLIMTAASIQAGLDNFPQWMRAWRWGMLLTHLGIGYTIFFVLFRRGLIAAALGSSVWLFGRWSLMLFNSGQIDGLAILPLLISLLLVHKKPWAAWLLFGLSISIKQMAGPLLPLYLIWAWQGSVPGRRWKELCRCLLLVALIPACVSLPFLVWDAESFLRMILFPMTRAEIGGRTVDSFLGLQGTAAKLPLILSLMATYLIAARYRVTVWAHALIVLFTLLSFSPAFFTRYLCWIVPLIPLAGLGGWSPSAGSAQIAGSIKELR